VDIPGDVARRYGSGVFLEPELTSFRPLFPPFGGEACNGIGVVAESRIALGVGDDLLDELPGGPTGDVVLDGIGPEVFLAAR
jgi:hypothetical protein